MIDILADFNEAVEVLEKIGARYAVVGGVAVALHGGERSTFDVDFLIHPDDLDSVVAHLKARGFAETAQAWTFKSTGLTLRRVWRLRPGREDVSLLDLLFSHQPEYAAILASVERLPWARGRVSVARAEDIIWMKSGAGRLKDQADIAALKARMEGHDDDDQPG